MHFFNDFLVEVRKDAQHLAQEVYQILEDIKDWNTQQYAQKEMILARKWFEMYTSDLETDTLYGYLSAIRYAKETVKQGGLAISVQRDALIFEEKKTISEIETYRDKIAPNCIRFSGHIFVKVRKKFEEIKKQLLEQKNYSKYEHNLFVLSEARKEFERAFDDAKSKIDLKHHTAARFSGAGVILIIFMVLIAIYLTR